MIIVYLKCLVVVIFGFYLIRYGQILIKICCFCSSTGQITAQRMLVYHFHQVDHLAISGRRLHKFVEGSSLTNLNR